MTSTPGSTMAFELVPIEIPQAEELDQQDHDEALGSKDNIAPEAKNGLSEQAIDRSLISLRERPPQSLFESIFNDDDDEENV